MARSKAWQSELRGRLTAFADRLEQAPANTRENSDRYAARAGVDAGAAHQAGALEQICHDTAGDLRRALSIYLPEKKATS